MKRTVIILLALSALLLGCGDDDEAAGDGGATTDDGGGRSAGTGTLAVRIEPVDGVFVEGFELGFRVETADGEVLDAVRWGDHVASLDSAEIEAFYDSVYELEVPAGDVVVHGEVNVGIGPAPSVPDVEGDLPCRLDLTVGEGERVEVEATFDTTEDCLRLVE